MPSAHSVGTAMRFAQSNLAWFLGAVLGSGLTLCGARIQRRWRRKDDVTDAITSEQKEARRECGQQIASAYERLSQAITETVVGIETAPDHLADAIIDVRNAHQRYYKAEVAPLWLSEAFLRLGTVAGIDPDGTGTKWGPKEFVAQFVPPSDRLLTVDEYTRWMFTSGWADEVAEQANRLRLNPTRTPSPSSFDAWLAEGHDAATSNDWVEQRMHIGQKVLINRVSSQYPDHAVVVNGTVHVAAPKGAPVIKIELAQLVNADGGADALVAELQLLTDGLGAGRPHTCILSNNDDGDSGPEQPSGARDTDERFAKLFGHGLQVFDLDTITPYLIADDDWEDADRHAN